MTNKNWIRPLIAPVLRDLKLDPSIDWYMEPAECLSLIALLEHRRPQVSIEVGTKNGGSLQVLSRFSKKVYSIDSNPVGSSLSQRFKNVEFLTGRSGDVLPRLIASLNRNPIDLGLILLDGDHSTHATKKDIESVILYIPMKTTFILMHDSYMPSAREGIRTADWSMSPFVRQVEVDFIPGISSGGRLCGGLSLAVMDSTPRRDDLEISAHYQHAWKNLQKH